MRPPVPWLLALIGAVVALDVPPDELGERVVLRLLDEDLSLVPAGAPAPVALLVAVRGHWLEVEARGQREVIQQIEAEPRAVAELEVLQRALIVVERAGVLPAASESTTTPTTPTQVHLTSWAALSPGLRGRLGHAVLGAGYGVSRSSGAVRLCATAIDGVAGGAVVEVRVGAGERCGGGPAVWLDASRPWAEVLRGMLERSSLARREDSDPARAPVALEGGPGDRAREDGSAGPASAGSSGAGSASAGSAGAGAADVSLAADARAGGAPVDGPRSAGSRGDAPGVSGALGADAREAGVAPGVGPSASPSALASPSGPGPLVATRSSTTAGAPLRLGFTAGAGAWIRSGGVDPALTVGAQLARSGLGGRLDVTVVPATRGTVGVTEVLIAGGPRLAWDLGERWSFAASLRAGALLHAYDVDGSTSGLHVDFSADVLVEAGLRLGEHLGLRAAVGPGFASRQREHLLGEAVLWSRGPLRLGLTLGLDVLP